MYKCNVMCTTAQNEDILFPTVASLCKAVLATGNFLDGNYITFRTTLLGMNSRIQKKSDVEWIFLDDPQIILWRENCLLSMEKY